jgi:hypothetical protein
MNSLEILAEKTAEVIKDWDNLNEFDDEALSLESRNKFYAQLGAQYYKIGNYELATTALLKTADPCEHGELFNLSLKKYEKDIPEKKPGEPVAGIKNLEYVLSKIYANNHQLSLQPSNLDVKLLEQTVDLMTYFIEAKGDVWQLCQPKNLNLEEGPILLFCNYEEYNGKLFSKYSMRLFRAYEGHSNHLFDILEEKCSTTRSHLEHELKENGDMDKVQEVGRILSKELSLFELNSNFGVEASDKTLFKTKLKEDLVKCCEYMIINTKSLNPHKASAILFQKNKEVVLQAMDWLKQCGVYDESCLQSDCREKIIKSIVNHYKAEGGWDSKFKKKLNPYIPESKRKWLSIRERIFAVFS